MNKRPTIDQPKPRIGWQSWTAFAVILGAGIVGLIILTVAAGASR